MIRRSLPVLASNRHFDMEKITSVISALKKLPGSNEADFTFFLDAQSGSSLARLAQSPDGDTCPAFPCRWAGSRQ